MTRRPLSSILGSSKVLVGGRFFSFHAALFVRGGCGDADGDQGGSRSEIAPYVFESLTHCSRGCVQLGGLQKPCVCFTPFAAAGFHTHSLPPSCLSPVLCWPFVSSLGAQQILLCSDIKACLPFSERLQHWFSWGHRFINVLEDRTGEERRGDRGEEEEGEREGLEEEKGEERGEGRKRWKQRGFKNIYPVNVRVRGIWPSFPWTSFKKQIFRRLQGAELIGSLCEITPVLPLRYVCLCHLILLPPESRCWGWTTQRKV